MRLGTRTVLFGAHQFAIHPWFVALAWWKLYSFPLDPRLWAAFFVHDLGYLGKLHLDDPDGEWHVAFGARILGYLFDHSGWRSSKLASILGPYLDHWFGVSPLGSPLLRQPSTWYQFGFYHSRYMAKRYGVPPSKLCYADKLAFVITPAWVYLPLVWLTGEWKEYAKAHNHEVHHDSITLLGWYYPSRAYVRDWVKEHQHGEADTWTQDKPSPQSESKGMLL